MCDVIYSVEGLKWVYSAYRTVWNCHTGLPENMTPDNMTITLSDIFLGVKKDLLALKWPDKMTIGLYDTFAVPQGCHFIRGAMYLVTDWHIIWSVKVVNGSDDPSDQTCPTRKIHDPGINTGPVQCYILVDFDGLDRLNGSTHRPGYNKLTRLGKIDNLNSSVLVSTWQFNILNTKWLSYHPVS